MTPWNGYELVTVITACTTADGSPGFGLTEVLVTFDEYNDGLHYEITEGLLRDRDYEPPFVHFDQFEIPDFLEKGVREWINGG